MAYLYFKMWLTSSYRDNSSHAMSVVAGHLPRRSMTETATRAGISGPTLSQHAKKWAWNDRASAYDSHLLQRHTDGVLESMDEAKIRNARLLDQGMRLVELTINRLTDVMAAEKTTTKEALQIAKVDLPKLLDRVLHHRALLVGAPTANEAVSVAFGDDWDLTALTDEELATFARLRAKVKRG